MSNFRPISTQIIRTSEPEPAGTWGHAAPSTRKRIGLSPVSDVISPISSNIERYKDEPQQEGNNRILSDAELWEVYLRCPDVRSAIDAIVRRVSTWDWAFESTLDPASDEYEVSLTEAGEAAAFFISPNDDKEPIQELLGKFTRDLLVYDHGAWELVYDTVVVRDEDGQELYEEPGRVKVAVGEELQEVVALRGADIYPITNKHGRKLGYNQITDVSRGVQICDSDYEPTFSNRQILAQQLGSNTNNERIPLIDTILIHIMGICLSAQHAMRSFNSELPPGILVLAGLSQQAGQDAKNDFKNQRGRADNIHVMTTRQPGVGANWIELSHTAVDVDSVNVTKQIRRTIWRVFGVMPIEMGDSEDMPRAVGTVQVEVAGSHLINPILELLEQRINSKLLPLLPGGQNNRIRFRFDRDAKLTPGERKTQSETVTSLVEHGLLTRNEGRKEMAYAPFGDIGDVATVKSGNRIVRLDVALAEGLGDNNPTPEGGGDEGETQAPDEDTEGDAPSSRDHQHHECDSPECVHRDVNLPSSWPSSDTFEGYRTLDLEKLGDIVERYTRDVNELYDQSMVASEAILAATYKPGDFGDEEASALRAKLFSVIDELEVNWSMLTSPMYTETAKLSRDTATDWSGQPVGDNYRVKADDYHRNAMGYLSDTGGLTFDLRARTVALMEGMKRANEKEVRAKIPELATSSIEDAVEALSSAWSSMRFRVKNWSGRLVELANNVLTASMNEESTVVDPVTGLKSTDWFTEWVAVSDKSTCSVCETEALAGFVLASARTREPGGDTPCRGKCRCVMTWWTRSEVENGTAVKLN